MSSREARRRLLPVLPRGHDPGRSPVPLQAKGRSAHLLSSRCATHFCSRRRSKPPSTPRRSFGRTRPSRPLRWP